MQTMSLSESIKSLKDIEKVEELPLEKRISVQNTYDLLLQAANNFGDKTALIFLPDGKPMEHAPSLTYKQLLQRINQTANLFTQKFNIAAGDAISFLLPNIPEAYFTLWAAEAVGIANPISPLLDPEVIVRLLVLAETKLLITVGEKLNPFWQSVIKARELYQKQTGKLLKLVVIHGEADERNNIFNFETLLEEQPDNRLVNKRLIKKDDICAYFHSSGTTALPKLAMLTHWGKMHQAWAISQLFDYKEGDVFLCGMPLFHVAAPIVAGNAAFMTGATIVLMSPQGWMNPNVIAHFWQIVERYQGTHTAALPFVYSALLQNIMDADIGSLRVAISGTDSSILHEFEEKTKVPVTVIYGSTESTCISAANPLHAHRSGSMGLRLPYGQIRVVEVDAKGKYVRDCEIGEEGVLCIKGPHVAHYKQDSLNEYAFIDSEWLNMGDIGKKDKDGYFYITCRVSDMIYRKNKAVSTFAIEQALISNPKIKAVAVVGQPNELEGEIPLAMVELHSEQSCSGSELMEWIKKEIQDASHYPDQIDIWEKPLPINGMGKVQKTYLRYEIIQTTLRNAIKSALQHDCTFEIKVMHDEFAQIIAEVEILQSDDKNIQEKFREILANFDINFNLKLNDTPAFR
jgi:fatty-acyl-CoA synthase